MLERNGNEVAEKGERRTERRKQYTKIGTTYMILRDRTIMRSTSTAMKRYEKCENGRIDFTRIE
jgi:hypothetical protein